MRKKKIIGITMLVLLAIILAAAAFYVRRGLTPVDMGADYTETTDYVSYPGEGFYKPVYLSLNNRPADEELKENLLVMRIGLGDFSDNFQMRNGEQGEEDSWEPISQEFLDMLGGELKACRENKMPVVLRFAYDNFHGWKDCEPSIEGIVFHIDQLSPVFKEYKDVIYCIESGLLGPFGEQHSSEIVTQENINTLLDALLEATDDNTQISVRRPSYYAGYVGITEAELASYQAPVDSPYYRIGIFNDGYLGSHSDCGTFSNRDLFNIWMTYQGAHTVYGSEATIPNGDDADWTFVDGICEEMFLTHTSYLNGYFNQRVIDRWKDTVYSGSDETYRGQTVYDYVKNHLGYRYVLRSAKYTRLFNSATIYLSIENVGDGNALRNGSVKLIAVDENGSCKEFLIDTDIRDWTSGAVADLTAPIDLSGLSGNCNFYLKITDGLGNILQLANNENEFKEEIGSFIGSFSI